jgi:preprotein translocase subunit SecA
MNFDIRKQLIDFDNVMNKQREVVYNLRNEILDGEEIITRIVEDMIRESVEENICVWTVRKHVEEWDWVSIEAWLFRIFCIEYKIINSDKMGYITKEILRSEIVEKVFEAYEDRKKQLTPEVMSYIQRVVFLQMIDSSWRDHLYELDQLKQGINFRTYAQKDPKIEYQRESFILFESMMRRIRENTIEYIFRVQVDIKHQGMELSNVNPSLVKNNTIRNSPNKFKDLNRIGRNDLCPCGSEKKYKKCCGR